MAFRDSLMSVLARSDSRTIIRAAIWGLERTTGIRTEDLLRKQTDVYGFSTVEGSPQDWYTRNGFQNIADALGYGTASIDSALGVGPIMACAKILGEDMGALPFFLFKRAPDRKSSAIAYDHPLYSILHDAPNEEIGASTFVESMTAQAALVGEAFALITRFDTRVTGLFPLPIGSVRREKNQAGMLIYSVRDEEGKETKHPRQDIFDLIGFSINGKTGDSLLRRAAEVIGLTRATQAYPARFFTNDATPGIVLTRPAGLPRWSESDLAQAKQAWMNWHQGYARAHMPAILQDGMTAARIDPDHGKLQLVEQRQFQVIEIARLFRMPPHKLADLSRATFCLPADSEVFTEEGPRCISQIRTGDVVWSYANDGTLVKAPVLRSGMSGYDRVLSFKTTNRTLRMNARHRVLARVKKQVATVAPGGSNDIEGMRYAVKWETEWIQAGELKVGDTVLALARLPVDGCRDLPNGRPATVEFLELAGLIAGDGNISMVHGQPVGVQIARAAQASYMDHYRQSANSLFHSQGSRPIKLTEGDRQTRFKSVSAARELQLLGLGGTARTKRVPGWVFGLTEELRLAYLRGYLDADGSVDKLGRASFSSCNRELLSAVRHLCMSVGVPVTNLRCQVGTTTLPNGKLIEYKQFCFTCSDPGSNLRIGSHDVRYKERLATGRPFGRKGRNYPRYGGRGFDSPGCELTRIISIEEGAIEPVYDLEVEGHHSFIADGSVVHNSNIEHQAIEYVSNTLVPWVVRWRQSVYRNLLTVDERAQGYFAEHNVEAAMRGDFTSQAVAWSRLQEKGDMTINEVRGKLNLPPAKGGDRLWIQMNMQAVADATSGKPIAQGTKLMPVEDLETGGYVNGTGGSNASN